MITLAEFGFVVIKPISAEMIQRMETSVIGFKAAKATYKALRRNHPNAQIEVTTTVLVSKPWIRRKGKGRAL